MRLGRNSEVLHGGAVRLEQVKVDAGPAIAADAVALRAMPSFDARDYISRRKSMSEVPPGPSSLQRSVPLGSLPISASIDRSRTLPTPPRWVVVTLPSEEGGGRRAGLRFARFLASDGAIFAERTPVLSASVLAESWKTSQSAPWSMTPAPSLNASTPAREST